MYTMNYDITVGTYRIGMLDKVEIHSSVELLSDTARIQLPASEYGIALEVEDKIHRGDTVCIRLGYEETGLEEEFRGYLTSITTDGDSIILDAEDELFTFRRDIPSQVHVGISLEELLRKVISDIGQTYTINCTYRWSYSRLVINNSTAYDVLKKVQEESGADIYLKDGILHIHPPGEMIGSEHAYDFYLNIEESDLTYRTAADKKVSVIVKATMPDGSVKEVETGTPGGEKIEINSTTTDTESMKQRGRQELMRSTFDGYDGTITTWLIPQCRIADSVTLRDRDYPHRDGCYFVRAVTTEFSKEGGKRKIELGFRIS